MNFEIISTVFSISSTSDFFAKEVQKFSLRLSTIVMASPTPLNSFQPQEEVDWPVQGGEMFVVDRWILFLLDYTFEEV